MRDKSNDGIKAILVLFAAVGGFLWLFYLTSYEYRLGADYGWLSGFFATFLARHETEKPEVNPSPIELKVDGVRYFCRLNNSSGDGKEAHLCLPVEGE